ncbi:HutD family protein [Paraburkholderia sp. CNPSo 3274]|uniref:HutD/Ves family protein n=1 Tax=Paraburkholderia sp. CNPSo 3274 TaxID=2940932 RepID=UPI0020B7B1CF|nr:HutD family protein [Paraburkholderia sp. CNPSo 3274]MCP3707011.1 HutD family protein [Paraburkholderia sp. CNPSo 3274]
MSRSSVLDGKAGANVMLLRGADLVPAPWKNGGGVTREIAAGSAASAPSDGFAWRASLADIAQGGPFSCFAGIDRTLVLIEGAALQLDEARAGGQEPRATHTLERALDIARFAGESAIDARIAAGPVRVFNLMVRREAARGALEVWREASRRSLHAQTVLLHAVQRRVEVRVAGEGFIALAPGDTLRVDAEQAVDLETRGAGALLAVTLDIAQA